MSFWSLHGLMCKSFGVARVFVGIRVSTNTGELGGVILFDNPLIFRSRIMKLNMSLFTKDEIRANQPSPSLNLYNIYKK